jgi:hypothetical protein
LNNKYLTGLHESFAVLAHAHVLSSFLPLRLSFHDAIENFPGSDFSGIMFPNVDSVRIQSLAIMFRLTQFIEKIEIY